MRGKVLSAIALGATIALLVGCHTNNKYKYAFKAKEEVIEPPNEPRFDNPPSAEYRPRVKDSDDKTLLGGNKNAGAGGFSGPGGLGGPGKQGGF